MKIKGVVRSLAFAGALALSSCSVNSDLKLENLRNKIYDIKKNKISLDTITFYKTEPDGLILENNLLGDGVKVKHDGLCYILTADHVVSFHKQAIDTPLGVEYYPVIRVSEETYLNGKKLDEIVNDPEKGIAIFKGNDCDDSVQLGDSSQLKLLDDVYLIGNPRNGGVRPGIVGNERKKAMFMEIYGYSISANPHFGDSGNPVINHNGEIVGFLSEKHFVSGFMIPINKFKEYMK